MEETPESARSRGSTNLTEQPGEKGMAGGESTIIRAEHPTGSSFTGATTHGRQVEGG